MEPYIDQAIEATKMVVNETIAYNHVMSVWVFFCSLTSVLILAWVTKFFWDKARGVDTDPEFMMGLIGTGACALFALSFLVLEAVPFLFASWFAPTARAIRTLIG